MSHPLLSVCILTYNHAKFIEKAIESVLNQKSDFKWEIIIADDCSTDGTIQIIQQFVVKYPQLIKPIFRESNQGVIKNFIELLSYPKSKYIAYLEGDDYWVDDYKLQKQVDFLENNDGYEVCFHNALITYDESLNELPSAFDNGKKIWNDSKKTYELENILDHFTIPLLTIVFRNNITSFPPQILKVLNGDAFLSTILLLKGKAYFMDEVMAHYRVHQNGSWSAKGKIYHLKNTINTYKQIIQILPSSLYPKIVDKINNLYYQLLYEFNKIHSYKSFFIAGSSCVFYNFSMHNYKAGVFMAFKTLKIAFSKKLN